MDRLREERRREVELVWGCLDMMKEAASHASLTVSLREYTCGGEKNLPAIDIEIRDSEGYLIGTSYQDVGYVLGFIKGYLKRGEAS